MELTSYLLGKKAGGGGSSTLQTKSVTITSNGTQTVTPDEDYDGLDKVNITTSVTSRDWSAIGYQAEPSYIQNGYDYALQIKQTWSNRANLNSRFKEDRNLIYLPGVNMSNATSMTALCKDCSSLVKVPAMNTSLVTNMSQVFQNCTALKEVGLIDTSSASNTSFMFNSCSSLPTIPQFNTGNVTTMANMFASCFSLTSIPLLNTSNVTTTSYMFSGCKVLTTIPQLNMSNVTDMGSMFSGCSEIVSIPELDASKVTNVGSAFDNCTKLQNFGGLKNIGQAYLTTDPKDYSIHTVKLNSSNSLTHESLMNVINNLYDIASAGVQQQTLQIGITNKNKLTAEEIAIATNKGWKVS